MPITNNYGRISRELSQPLRYDTMGLCGEEGWIAIENVLKMGILKKQEIDEETLLAIGNGSGSLKDGPIYELDISKTKMRSVNRSLGKTDAVVKFSPIATTSQPYLHASKRPPTDQKKQTDPRVFEHRYTDTPPNVTVPFFTDYNARAFNRRSQGVVASK